MRVCIAISLMLAALQAGVAAESLDSLGASATLAPQRWEALSADSPSAAEPRTLAALEGDPPAEYPGYTLVYQDTFDGDTLNPAVFTARNDFVHTRWDLVCYQSSSASVSGGFLHLFTSFVEPAVSCVSEGSSKEYSYVSAWVDTIGKLQLPAKGGIVELRAKLPPPSFRAWPSSFLIADSNKLDTGVCWPLSTEIDMYEVAGGFGSDTSGLGSNAMCSSYHWGTSCFQDEGATLTGCVSEAELDTTQFHIYTVKWTTDFIEWSTETTGAFYVMTTATSGLTSASFPAWKNAFIRTVPGISLPSPNNFELIMQSALAWWVPPQNAAPGDVGIGRGSMEHIIDWVRFWAPK